MTPGRILVVDDDPWIQRIVARALGQRGHQVSLAGEATGAFVVASKIKPGPDPDRRSRCRRSKGGPGGSGCAPLPACADAPIIFLLSDVDEYDVHLGRRRARSAAAQAVPDGRSGAGGRYSSRGRESEYPRRGKRRRRPKQPKSNLRPDTGRSRRCAAPSIELGLASVLTVLEMERKSGILLCERESGVGAALPAQGAGRARRQRRAAPLGRRRGLRGALLADRHRSTF